jgi:hypothetical protein
MAKQVPEMTVSDEERIRLAAVVYCKEHGLDYTLGTMNEMAKFAIDCLIEADKEWARRQPHTAQ